MRKVQILCAAFFAVLAFGVVSVAIAAAEELPVWLKSGAEVTKAEEALTDGTAFVHHKPPALLGGGEITVECKGQFHGTVGPGMKDELTKQLDEKGKEKALECIVSASSNGTCPTGTDITIEPENLPWKTELLLVAGKILDDVSGNLGYAIECKSIEALCAHEEKLVFSENSANGAVFEFVGLGSISCSDGGTATILGKGTVLGYEASIVVK